jgi:hypothetical protein
MIYVSVTWGVHILQLMLWKKIRQLRLIASQTLNPEEKSKVRGLQKLQQGATHVTDTRVLPENGEQPEVFSDQASTLLSKTCMLIS